MQFLKSTVADYQLRTKISRAIADVTSNHRLTLKLADCDDVIPFAEEHPKIVLHYIHERLSGTSHTAAYLSVLLLDILVNTCSYAFHEVLASEKSLQQRLVQLASERAESDSQRKVRSAARNVVLDFSRTFFDDSRLVSLSLLAEQVERKTGKKLLRSIQIERINVAVLDPRPEDIVLISPIRRGPTGRPLPPNVGTGGGNDGSTVLHVGGSPNSSPTSSSPAMSKFWICERCTFVNSNSLEKCNACGYKRPLFDAAVISSPTTTNPPSHHKTPGNVHPGSSSSFPTEDEIVREEPSISSSSSNNTHVDPHSSERIGDDTAADEAEAEAKRARLLRLRLRFAWRLLRLRFAERLLRLRLRFAWRLLRLRFAERLLRLRLPKRAADEAEAKRLADEAEAEAKRVVDEAEAKRLADEAEAEA
ncbi:Hypothetical protein, putative, partial [Bodo saltans]